VLNWRALAQLRLELLRMGRLKNAQIEQHYFERFRKDFQLPEGEVVYTDKPDILVKGKKTNMGIEVTRLFIKPGSDLASMQVQHGRQERVLKQAQLNFVRNGGRGLELSIDFNPEFPILNIDEMALALSNLADDLVGMQTGLVSKDLFRRIKSVRSIYITFSEYPEPKWHPTQLFSVPELSLDRLLNVVKEKSSKLSEYQICDEYWLLLIVDFMDPAQNQNFPRQPISLDVETAYNKILIYKPQYREVMELQF